jgi:hypothetical protein
MEPFQERVIEEKAELDKKCEALRRFLNSEGYRNLPLEERQRLRNQWDAMNTYSQILDERIAAFSLEKLFVTSTQVCISELETELKKTLTVLRDIVAVMRHEPALQGSRYKDLGIEANRILSKHRM